MESTGKGGKLTLIPIKALPRANACDLNRPPRHQYPRAAPSVRINQIPQLKRKVCEHATKKDSNFTYELGWAIWTSNIDNRMFLF